MPSLALTFWDAVKIIILLGLASGFYVWAGGAHVDPLTLGQFGLRLAHVLIATVWLGLLWSFNLVELPVMARLPDSLKPALTQYLLPTALFWFRWAALATVVTGLGLAGANGYLLSALSFGFSDGGFNPMNGFSFGLWLALIMAANVWVVIWPNQRRALGLVPLADPQAKEQARRRAFLAARINTLLSFPMLYGMVALQNPF